MKTFCQLQNKATNKGKPKRVNLNFNGECLTNDEVIDRLKRKEEQRNVKKTSTRKLNFDEILLLSSETQTQSNHKAITNGITVTIKKKSS